MVLQQWQLVLLFNCINCNSIKEILTLSWSKIWSVYLCLIFLRLFFRYDLFTFFLNLVCSKCVVSSFLQLLLVKGSCPIIYYIVPSLHSFTFFYNTYLFIKYMIFCKKLFILISLHTALLAFIFVQKPFWYMFRIYNLLASSFLPCDMHSYFVLL